MPATARLRTVFLLAALTTLGPSDRGGLAAQAAQQDSQAPRAPTFRVSTQLIQLDVVVTDFSGTPVDSLVAEDFEIKQDGKSQPVRFAQYLASGSSSATGKSSSGARDNQRESGDGSAASKDATLARSPAAGAGRRIVVVVGDNYMEFDSVARSKEALAAFVGDSWREGDLWSIVGTNDPAHQPLEFTAEPEALARQISRIQWSAIKRQRVYDRAFMQSACSGEQLDDDLRASSFKHGTLGIMASALEQLRALPGRKALLLVADGIQTCPEQRAEVWERLRRLADYANRSAVVIYGVQTLPFTSGVKMPEQRAAEADIRGTAIHPPRFVNTVSEYMRSLSVRTGGFARRTNDIRDQLTRVLTDFGGYYLLSYEPPPDTFQPGKPKFRKVSVHVRNGRLRVRARPGFYSVDDERVFAR